MIRWVTILPVVLLAIACEDSSRVLDGNSNSKVDGGSDADSDADSDGDADGDDDDDSSHKDSETECDRQEFSIEPMPVRLMILQDITESMAQLMGEANQKKWDVAKFALTNMLTKMAGKGVEIGFDVFNDGSQQHDPACGYEHPLVMDCAINNETNIIDIFPSFLPWGSTPIYCAMGNFLDPSYAPKFVASGAYKYLLLVSDGKDNCGTSCDKSVEATEQDFIDRTKELLDAGIKTFVIGFNIPMDPGLVDQEQLNAIAAAGGTDFKTFFDAQSGEEVESALDEVGKAIIDCVFEIDEPKAEADPEKVNFYFGDDVIPHDVDCGENEGWTWVDAAHTKVEFCKQACDAFAEDISKKISASFGCPTVEIDVL